MIGPGELSQLEWRNPWWLALALQPWLAGWLLRLRRKKIYRYADTHLLPWAMRGSFETPSGKWRNLANIAAWLLLACAAAGPRLPLLTAAGQPTAIPRHEINLMIVLDVSPSMLAEDISPQRLQRAKLELLDLLPRLHGERTGLIAFSGNAGLLMPLSRDEAALRYYLTLAEPSLFEAPGSDIGAALDLARRSLLAQTAKSGGVLLLTDGDSTALTAPMLTAARTAAERLRQAGLPLYVMGIATPAGSTIPQAEGGVLEHDGAAVTSRLDAAYLTALAGLGGGKYTGVQDGNGDWNALYDNGILRLPGNSRAAEPAQAWQELYAWCLLPAWLLLLYVYFPLNRLGSRADIAGWLLAGMLGYHIGMPSAHAADDATVHAAYAAYRSGDYAGAQALYARMGGYAAAMGGGAAAYRQHNYADAIRQFTTAMLSARSPGQRADALYNLGNSYFAAGNFATAADAYQGVLTLRPRDANAGANLALASGRLAMVRKHYAKVIGISGHRGHQVGGGLDQPIDNQRVTMEDRKKQTGPEVSLANPQDTDQAHLRGKGPAAANQQKAPDQAYPAALKKLEFTTDRPAQLQKELLKQDAAANSADSGELLPW